MTLRRSRMGLLDAHVRSPLSIPVVGPERRNATHTTSGLALFDWPRSVDRGAPTASRYRRTATARRAAWTSARRVASVLRRSSGAPRARCSGRATRTSTRPRSRPPRGDVREGDWGSKLAPNSARVPHKPAAVRRRGVIQLYRGKQLQDQMSDSTSANPVLKSANLPLVHTLHGDANPTMRALRHCSPATGP